MPIPSLFPTEPRTDLRALEEEMTRDVPTYNKPSADDFHERQALLYDLQQLEGRGVRLTRTYTVDDSVDDMTVELKRQLMVLDERSNVSMLKNGLRIALTGIELVNVRLRLLDLEGWSREATTELDRQDANLSKIYRKYWRRSSSNNPEMEILMSLLGSMGAYHMKRSMTRHMVSSRNRPTDRRRASRVADPDSSDEEDMPPTAR